MNLIQLKLSDIKPYPNNPRQNDDAVDAVAESIRQYLTDPPYNVAYVGGTQDAMTMANDALSDNDYYELLQNAFVRAVDVMKDGAVFYIFHADSKGLDVRKAVKDAGLETRQCLIWVKNTLVMGRQNYQWKHEPCLYGWKDGAAHHWGSDRCQTTIMSFDRPTKSTDHPTMKPVKLFDYLIQNSTRPGWNVYDGFFWKRDNAYCV